MTNAPANEIGYTLIELSITITIMAVIAAIAVPAFSSGQDKKLQAAAQEFAAAMRFARSESIRTGEPYAFQYQTGIQRIRVWRVNASTNPVTIINDVYHPVDKQIYDFNLEQQSLAAAETITRNTLFRGTCSNPDMIYFAANGSPWCAAPPDVLLESYELTFQSGSVLRSLTLDGITGRVTVN